MKRAMVRQLGWDAELAGLRAMRLGARPPRLARDDDSTCGLVKRPQMTAGMGNFAPLPAVDTHQVDSASVPRDGATRVKAGTPSRKREAIASQRSERTCVVGFGRDWRQRRANRRVPVAKGCHTARAGEWVLMTGSRETAFWAAAGLGPRIGCGLADMAPEQAYGAAGPFERLGTGPHGRPGKAMARSPRVVHRAPSRR